MIAAEKRVWGATAEQWALIVALPLNQAGNIAIFTVLGPLRADFGLSYVALGAVLASYGLARFVTNIPAGVLIRRMPLRTALLLGMLANLVAAVGPLGANAVWHVVAARIVQGASSAVVQAAILVWLIMSAHSTTRGRVMALSEALFSVIGLVLPLATGALALALGWRAAFASATIAAVLGILAVVLGTSSTSAPDTVPEPAAQATQGLHGGQIRQAFSVGGGMLLGAMLLAFIVAFSRFGMISTLLPVIGADELGLTPMQVGFAQTLVNIGGIAFLMVGGWAGDRLGRQRLVVPGVILLLLSQLTLFAISNTAGYYVIATVQAAGFFMNSFPTSLVGDVLPPHLRSIGIAAFRLVTDAAVLIAPVIVGAASDWAGLDAPKVVTVGATCLVLAILLLTAQRSTSGISGG